MPLSVRVLRRFIATHGGAPCPNPPCQHRFLSFPEAELPDLQVRLRDTGFAFTSRVDDECGKWGVGEVVASPLGHLWLEAILPTDLAGHPFLKELTPAQREFLARYPRIDVIRFAPLVSVRGR